MATTIKSTISQLSCFSSINRKLLLQTRSAFITIPRRPKSFVVMSLIGHGRDAASSELRANLTDAAEGSKPFIEEPTKSYPNVQGHVPGEMGTSEPEGDHVVTQQKKAAKIHDFCFGIPYGECASSMDSGETRRAPLTMMHVGKLVRIFVV